MGRYYSLELREKVISYIERGGSKSSAAFAIGLDTVYRWLRLHRSGSLRTKQRSNYSRKVSDEVILDYIKARHDDTLREIGLGVGLHSSKVWKY
ncbi:IS630 transposase-related protein [Candidatus Lariskella endosymbiont of Hedychridium roseum]|uniref:IS630 transposase-related protein n=1 Tax=Candidatus Lariskella endosymbiont of Hedychridium roseum TaxID=3077949 RepID=UPI00397771D9